MGFYTTGKRGTVTRRHPANIRGACKRLYEGMKGFGTNEDAITEVIASYTVAQRQEIKTKYKIMYGKDLIKELESELSGAFLKIILALMMHPEEYILETIRNAIVKSRGGKLLKKLKKVASKKGICSDAYTLLGVLCLRTNEQLANMKAAYKEKYETELEEDFGDKDFADEFRSLIFGIILAERDESSEVDLDLLQEDIENLQNGGGGSTKEEYFQAFFEERSWKHLKQLYTSYKEVTGQPIEKIIESSDTFSDIMKECFTAVIKLVRSEADYYAERLKEAIEGIGTDDDMLISTIVLRAEIDLVDIIETYEQLYGTSLEDDVIGDTSGDYKNILLKLLTVPEFDCSEAYVKPLHAKKTHGQEISTQTDATKEYDLDMAQNSVINTADLDGHEAVGHDVVEDPGEAADDDDMSVAEVESLVDLEVEEVEVEEKEENGNLDHDNEKANSPIMEEPIPEEEISEANKPTSIEELGEEMERAVEANPAELEAKEGTDNIVEDGDALGGNEQDVGETEEDDEEKKKPEQVDNAEGG